MICEFQKAVEVSYTSHDEKDVPAFFEDDESLRCDSFGEPTFVDPMVGKIDIIYLFCDFNTNRVVLHLSVVYQLWSFHPKFRFIQRLMIRLANLFQKLSILELRLLLLKHSMRPRY